MIGIIGGSGLYNIEEIKVLKSIKLQTPFGEPSDEYTIASIKGRDVVFLPRHGKGHKYPPHMINYRANIWGFRKLGVRKLFSISAVGGINRLLQPGDFVITDQFIDFTKKRDRTFYEGIHSKEDDTDYNDTVKEYLNNKKVVHIDVSEPFCKHMQNTLEQVIKSNNYRYIKNATYIATEGPRLETSAEIKAFGLIGADVVGMTLVPEVILARELNIHFVSLCVVTNLAAGVKGERLTSKEVIQMMEEKNNHIKKIIVDFVSHLSEKLECNCEDVLKDAAI